ncbi:MAG: hypothetical protein WD039_06960 [Xanthobacteraceae bacterium]
MAAITTKKFNWVQRPTAWEHMQAWRQNRRAMMQRFQAEATIATNGIANAMYGLSEGMSVLAAKAAIKQAQETLAAKRAQVNKLV